MVTTTMTEYSLTLYMFDMAHCFTLSSLLLKFPYFAEGVDQKIVKKTDKQMRDLAAQARRTSV